MLTALQLDEYYKYGLSCGLAIVNGSVGPHFFSPPVVDSYMAILPMLRIILIVFQ